MNKNLIKSIVRNHDGSVNAEDTKAQYTDRLLEVYAASMEAAEKKLKEEHNAAVNGFDAALATYVETRSGWDMIAAEYINRQFDRFKDVVKGGCITKPVLVTMSRDAMMNDRRIEFSQFRLAEQMIGLFIDDNSCAPDAEPEELATALFTISKGINGGVRRIKKDAPVPDGIKA